MAANHHLHHHHNLACPTPETPTSLAPSSPKPRPVVSSSPAPIPTAPMSTTPGCAMVLPPPHDSQRTHDRRIPVVIYSAGRNDIVAAFADVLGRPFRLQPEAAAGAGGGITLGDQGRVVGVLDSKAMQQGIARRDRELIVVFRAICVDAEEEEEEQERGEDVSEACDYEFLYSEASFSRQALARFLTFTLRQTARHRDILAQPGSRAVVLAVPDVRPILPKVEIAAIGADAIELRVDLLGSGDGGGGIGGGDGTSLPGADLVGTQLMLLRQQTELPVVFALRSAREAGRFPDHECDAYYALLVRAVKWGVEFVEVATWLDERRRKTLFEQRANTAIIASFHDASALFQWTSARAAVVYAESARYADVVRMTATARSHAQAAELERFRASSALASPSPPLAAFATTAAGQVLYPSAQVLAPITHPFLLSGAAKSPLSTVAQLNASAPGPAKTFYAVRDSADTDEICVPVAFYQKLCTELGLSHRFTAVDGFAAGSRCLLGSAWSGREHFGGAVLSPAVAIPYLLQMCGGSRTTHSVGEAARLSGMVDVVLPQAHRPAPAAPVPFPSPSLSPFPSPSPSPSVSPSSSGVAHPITPPTPPHTHQSLPGQSWSSSRPATPPLCLDNMSLRAIRRALTLENAPSAFNNRTALVIASCPSKGLPAMHALRSLGISRIYTVGFGTADCEQLSGMCDLERLVGRSCEGDDNDDDEGDGEGGEEGDGGEGHDEHHPDAPFAIVSAGWNGAAKTLLGAIGRHGRGSMRRVFLDLSLGSVEDGAGAVAGVARENGFLAHQGLDVAACVVSETVRELVGQNVSVGFARMAMGMGLC